MHDRVRTKLVFDPFVDGKPLVRRRTERVMENLADLAIAFRTRTASLRLDRYEDIPEFETRYHHVTIVQSHAELCPFPFLKIGLGKCCFSLR